MSSLPISLYVLICQKHTLLASFIGSAKFVWASLRIACCMHLHVWADCSEKNLRTKENILDCTGQGLAVWHLTDSCGCLGLRIIYNNLITDFLIFGCDLQLCSRIFLQLIVTNHARFSPFSARKALENRVDVDHDRCGELEQKLREAQALLAETENKSDEVFLFL